MESIIVDIERRRTSGDGMEQVDLASKIDRMQDLTETKKVSKKKCLPEKKNDVKRNEEISNCKIDHNEVSCGKKSISSRSSSSGRKISANLIEEIPNYGKTNNKLLPGLHSLYRKPEPITRSIAPVLPKGELVVMKPRLVSPLPNIPEHKKIKPPKFVPYEPYPGAVNPIIPRKNSGQYTPKPYKINKNNLDIGDLVNQMSSMRTKELNENQNESITSNEPEDELQKLRQELKKIKEERDFFNSQYKFQTQVNTELKNLLVASVGEDLQTHVNVLTEDKLQLARRLLDTAQNVTTHTEQIEFLASQCEVWRSKFLASSVMIEELARWKADLTQKNQMLSDSTKRLLETLSQLRQIQLDILRNLKFIAKIRYLNLPATDFMSLSAENLNIVQQIVLHSGVGLPEDNSSIASTSSNPLTDVEMKAIQAIEFISQPLMATDDAIRALFGQTNIYYKPSDTYSTCGFSNNGDS